MEAYSFGGTLPVYLFQNQGSLSVVIESPDGTSQWKVEVDQIDSNKLKFSYSPDGETFSEVLQLSPPGVE